MKAVVIVFALAVFVIGLEWLGSEQDQKMVEQKLDNPATSE